MAKQISLAVSGTIATKSTFTPGKINPRETAIASDQYSLWTLFNALIAARTFVREQVRGDQPGRS
jgi:hypothetical protein